MNKTHRPPDALASGLWPLILAPRSLLPLPSALCPLARSIPHGRRGRRAGRRGQDEGRPRAARGRGQGDKHIPRSIPRGRREEEDRETRAGPGQGEGRARAARARRGQDEGRARARRGSRARAGTRRGRGQGAEAPASHGKAGVLGLKQCLCRSAGSARACRLSWTWTRKTGYAFFGNKCIAKTCSCLSLRCCLQRRQQRRLETFRNALKRFSRAKASAVSLRRPPVPVAFSLRCCSVLQRALTGECGNAEPRN